MCMDEISTGLDAATTYDITRDLGEFTRMTKSIKIVSLLQPPPETVANFDEIILIADGKIVYSGPIEDVVDYFYQLGYEVRLCYISPDFFSACICWLQSYFPIYD